MMRKRDPELDARWGTICTPTRMQATDGKYYNTQAATMEGVFRITGQSDLKVDDKVQGSRSERPKGR